ncbi:4-hydroxybenzoate 3-monooxygenase [Plantactinospora sp. S1510]|uniref:4-hydroxybenzoate 3-monooxygenase n=1 Tax=Plantactinospora alkalitolerans TaxID=2789879 RepID=A0ABS0H3N4_9ACTN|nr:4-hydroxybenzoate 3-monooxygenase [Plantactinospora alkalitolerans]MBF9133078.1 4-hydroxybenzoate 3-monooxygenase [Plantactinospora alkalitolerans]
MRTQVGIVGAGPAGLLLSHLLHRSGIDSVVLERRSREYVEHRVRAGVLEQGSVDLLRRTGLGDRLDREGLRHEGIELRFGGTAHRVAMTELTGRAITVYGQQEVVKDLIAARTAAGGELRFEVEDVRLAGLDRASPVIRYRHQGREEELHCDFVAGCDGSHGVSRSAVPPGVLTEYERQYPFAWLGVLAAAAPAAEELIYAHHDRGFALHSMRSPEISRLYLQVEPDTDIADWPDDRIWSELRTRLETVPGWSLNTGPILEKSVTGMRSLVVEPMRWERLFLAGDAVHIVPPTGAKGMNLALADVALLGDAFAAWYQEGRDDLLTGYSDTALRRVWRAQHFSWWMTSLLHRLETQDPYEAKLQISTLHYLTSSRAYATSLAENYVGLAEV